MREGPSAALPAQRADLRQPRSTAWVGGRSMNMAAPQGRSILPLRGCHGSYAR